MPDSQAVVDPGRHRRCFEVLALAPLAVAQPLFDVLSRGADFFVAHGSRPADLLVFALAFYLGPVLLLVAFDQAAHRLAPALGRWSHRLVLALLIGLLTLPWLDRAGLPAVACLGAASLAGIGGAVAIERSSTLRSLLVLLAPLTLVVPLVFLLLSPVRELLWPTRVEALDVDIAAPVPVVMVVFDELPLVSLLDADRQIDAELFPNFASLAERSHWFPEATSVSPATNQAVPAILTGRYPAGERAAIASQHPQSLFTLLAESYDLEVIETQTELCPRRLCGGDVGAPWPSRLARLLSDGSVVYLHVVAPARLRDRLPSITGTWADFLGPDAPAGPPFGAPLGAPADGRAATDSISDLDLHIHATDRTRPVEAFLDRLTTSPPTSAPTSPAGGRPGLYFLHAMLPHIPWVYLPSGTEYWGSIYSSAFAHGVGRDTLWTDQEWLVAQGYQRHLLQVAFVDSLLGRIVHRMEESGVFDRALLLVTADHGLSFQPGEPGRHATERNFADIMSVPLFLHTPGQTEGTVDRRNVEIVDILPTIADVLGFQPPLPVDGRSMLDDGPPRSFKALFDGDHRTLYRPEDLERLDDSLAAKLAIFRHGLFRIGPRPEMIGRPVRELAIGEPVDVEIRLDQAEQFLRVDPSSGYLPAQIFGRARRRGEPEPIDLELAVAINGVVRAVTRTFEDRGARFAAMVPEESFVPGRNRVGVWIVETGAAGPLLRPTRENAAPTYSLVRDTSGEPVALEASDGSRCQLDATAVEGGYYRYDDGFAGWARAIDEERPYVAIMVFADGRLVHTASTGSRPPAEAAVNGQPGYGSSGFRFVLPAAVVEAAGELRLFAVIGPRGTELEPLPGGRPGADR